MESLSKLGETLHLQAGDLLKKGNSVERHLNFLLKGAGGAFINNESNVVCTDIFFEGDLIMDYFSFMFQEPSICEIFVFEPSIVLQIPHDKFDAYCKNEDSLMKNPTELLHTIYRKKYSQQVDILSKTAKQRYVELLKKDEGFYRVPLKYVASYLGVTPQSLSRIRGERF